MFEKFNFTPKQVERYYKSALRDYYIARKSDVPEVMFRFCYDALIKLAITLCVSQNLRVKSRTGHYIELIKKLSEYLNNEEINLIVNEMRMKRNRDLYGEGILISLETAKGYIEWAKEVFKTAERHINKNRRLEL